MLYGEPCLTWEDRLSVLPWNAIHLVQQVSSEVSSSGFASLVAEAFGLIIVWWNCLLLRLCTVLHSNRNNFVSIWEYTCVTLASLKYLLRSLVLPWLHYLHYQTCVFSPTMSPLSRFNTTIMLLTEPIQIVTSQHMMNIFNFIMGYIHWKFRF